MRLLLASGNPKKLAELERLLADPGPRAGGPGHEPVKGGPGHEPVKGGPGYEPVKGGPGYEPVKGGPGHEPVKGGPGYEPVKGGPAGAGPGAGGRAAATPGGWGSIEVVGPAAVGGLPAVEEDRPDFLGNARKKAASAARHAGLWSLADDSGLEVDALDGAPGVRSARYAGAHGDDAANNRRLLAELAGVPPERRGARFVCALVLARPDGVPAAEIVAEARGRILQAPRGAGGFGYDPLFLFTEPGHPETGRGFAELSPEEKARVGHRGRALRELVRRLPTLTP